MISPLIDRQKRFRFGEPSDNVAQLSKLIAKRHKRNLSLGESVYVDP